MRFVAAAWYTVVLNLAKVVFWFLGGIRVRHRRNVPQRGGVIIAPAHFSFLDPPAVACGTPRRLRFMAKEELFQVRVFGRLIKSLQAFPIKRGEGDMEAIRQAIRFVNEGEALLIFPEGTRGDGRTIGSINRGATMLAKRTGAPVIPVGISGTQVVLPKGASRPRRARITLVYGQPITYEEVVASAPPGVEPRDWFASVLQERLVRLCDEAGLKLKTLPSTVPTKPALGTMSPSEQPDY